MHPGSRETSKGMGTGDEGELENVGEHKLPVYYK